MLQRIAPRGRALLLTVLLTALVPSFADPPPARQKLEIPETDVGANLLPLRRANQLRAAAAIGVDHDFSFEDRLAASGITFVHHATDDGTKHFKMVHYDHGNALAVADVDGDGRLDLYFLSQIGPNELWRNLGDGRFEDITAAAGVSLADRVSVAASFADVDNDGDPDLYVTTVRMGNVLFANDGKGHFEDVTAQAGLSYSGHSSGAVFFDYDRDGLLDLFLVNVGRYTSDERGPGGYYVGLEDAFQGHLHPERTEASLLYHNLGGGRFEEVSEKTGLVDTGWSGDAAAADVNGDGWPDLYVLNMQGDDHYWENREGSRFVDRTDAVFPKTPWGAMGIKFFDWNGDGLVDLLLTDMHSDMGQEVDPPLEKLKSAITWSDRHLQGGADNLFGNAFWENRGNGRFEEISDAVGAESYWPWGVSVGDLNADGWQDVFIAASMSFPYRYGIDSVLLNDRGKTFRDAELILGVEPRAGGRTKEPWFDLDCDGEDRRHPLCNGRTGSYTVWGCLGTRTAAIFDLDDDGDLDIVTGEFNAPPQVLVSNLAQRREVRFLKVALQGTRSNRDGLGATVKVTAGGRVLTQFQDGKSGYLSQSSLPLYFGLGNATRVDRIEVLWPSGVRQVVEGGPGVDRYEEIVEP